MGRLLPNFQAAERACEGLWGRLCGGASGIGFASAQRAANSHQPSLAAIGSVAISGVRRPLCRGRPFAVYLNFEENFCLCRGTVKIEVKKALSASRCASAKRRNFAFFPVISVLRENQYGFGKDIVRLVNLNFFDL